MSPRAAVWIPAFVVLLLAAGVLVTVRLTLHDIGTRSAEVKDQNEAVAEAERALWAVRRINDLGMQLQSVGEPDEDFGFAYLDTFRTLEDLVRPGGFLALAEDPHLVRTIRGHVHALAYSEPLDATVILQSAQALDPMIDGVRRSLWARKRDSYVDYYQSVQATMRQLDTLFFGATAVCLLVALPLAVAFGLRLHRRARRAAAKAGALAGRPETGGDPLDDVISALTLLEARLHEEGAGGRLAEALDAEHRRIALDMHDDVLTELTALSRIADTLTADASTGTPVAPAALRNLREGMGDLAGDIRAVIDDLYPPVIETLGLASALEGQISRLQKRFADIRFAASIEPGAGQSLDRAQALSLYRAVREALANALRHSGADRIEVDMHRDGERLVLNVEDNGPRVSGDTPPEFTEGRGLAGIRHRAARLGGLASWTRSRFSTGTKLTVEVPLR